MPSPAETAGAADGDASPVVAPLNEEPPSSGEDVQISESDHEQQMVRVNKEVRGLLAAAGADQIAGALVSAASRTDRVEVEPLDLEAWAVGAVHRVFALGRRRIRSGAFTAGGLPATLAGSILTGAVVAVIATIAATLMAGLLSRRPTDRRGVFGLWALAGVLAGLLAGWTLAYVTLG